MGKANRCVVALATAPALLALWPAGAFAQDSKAALQAKVADLKQSLAANQKALQQYTWIEETQISLKGEVKKTERKECRYGTDGKVMKIDIPGAAPPPSGGGGGGGRRRGALKEKVVEKKVDELKDYMGEVSALVKEYVPPDPQKIQAAMQVGKGTLSKESPEIAEMSFTDYVLPGDRLALSFNSAAKQIATVNVDSYLGKEKDTVTLAVRFASLPEGVNYPAETVLVAKAKQIEVKISNSDYKK